MNEPKVFQADGRVFEVIDVASVTVEDIDLRLAEARASVSYLEQLRNKVESFNNPQQEVPAAPPEPVPAPDQQPATTNVLDPAPNPAEAPAIAA